MSRPYSRRWRPRSRAARIPGSRRATQPRAREQVRRPRVAPRKTSSRQPVIDSPPTCTRSCSAPTNVTTRARLRMTKARPQACPARLRRLRLRLARPNRISRRLPPASSGKKPPHPSLRLRSPPFTASPATGPRPISTPSCLDPDVANSRPV